MTFNTRPYGRYSDWIEREGETEAWNAQYDHGRPDMVETKLRGTHPHEVKAAKPQMLIYGEPGIGKSWFALCFPNVYYIDSEGSANLSHYMERLLSTGGTYFGKDEGASEYDEVIREVTLLGTEKHEYGTLVLDGFSTLFNRAVQEEFERLESAGQSAAFGADRKPAIARMRRLMRMLSGLDMNVVVICHAATNYVDGEEAGLKPDIHKDALYDVHLILEASMVAGKRWFRVIKSRYQQFEIGDRFSMDYEVFRKKWGGKDATQTTK